MEVHIAINKPERKRYTPIRINSICSPFGVILSTLVGDIYRGCQFPICHIKVILPLEIVPFSKACDQQTKGKSLQQQRL